MTSKKLFTADAVRLRLVLIVVLCLQIAGAIGIGALGIGTLNKRAGDVQQVVYDASNSDEKLQRVQELMRLLESNKESVERAKQVVAESKSYQYQDVIIRDLQAIAKRANIEITNFNFAAGGAATAAGKTATPTTPTPGGGLQSTTVNITLKTPLNYRNFLNFVHYIEQNLTKMQISKIGLVGVTDSPNSVESETLTIEVYVR